jgi:hypothetical protein
MGTTVNRAGWGFVSQPAALFVAERVPPRHHVRWQKATVFRAWTATQPRRQCVPRASALNYATAGSSRLQSPDLKNACRSVVKNGRVDSTDERNMIDIMWPPEDSQWRKWAGPGLSSQQKHELWARWKAGQSLSDGRGLGKHAGSIFGVLLSKGGKKRLRLIAG